MLKNPIPNLLEQIPDTLTLLDYTLLDKLRDTVKETTRLIVNNSCILALLTHLNEHKVISMHNISSEEDKYIYLIRNTYGRKDLS